MGNGEGFSGKHRKWSLLPVDFIVGCATTAGDQLFEIVCTWYSNFDAATLGGTESPHISPAEPA